MATAKKRAVKRPDPPHIARPTGETRAARNKATSGKSKKTASKKAASKKTAERAAAKKPAPAARKPAPAPKAAKAKKASGKSGAGKSPRPTTSRDRSGGKDSGRPVDVDVAKSDAELFGPLSEGERADALRALTQDSRLARMASVGRYRVIAVEPVAIKPPHPLSGKRAARVVIYDYAGDCSVDGCVDLDSSQVSFLKISRAQPMLAREEEAAAIAIAMSDERVKRQLSLGDEPRVAAHYWSRSDSSISFSRRSAAVIFGRVDSAPSLVAVVDLLDNLVCEIVPASQW